MTTNSGAHSPMSVMIVVEVLATDPGSVPDFKAWCASIGHELVEQDQTGGVYRYVIRKR